MTRRYRSFRSEVAKRPPSSGTSGRRSGGSTGSTSSTIQLGLMPDFLKASSTFRRLEFFLTLSFGAGQVAAQLLDLDVELDVFEQVLDAFGAHHAR